MQKPIFRAAPIRFADASGMSGENTHDVQLLRVGTFSHPNYGDLEITVAHLESMVKNFSDKVRGIDLAIDYSHANDKEAAGWIENLYLGGLDQDELWAKVRWTPNGVGAIKAKEFRYLSAEFSFSYVNDETKMNYGPTLFGAGLTNRPFVKGMEPIVELSEKLKGNIKMDEKQMEELKKQVADLAAAVAKLQKPEGDKGDGSGDGAGDGENDMSEMKKKMGDLQAENDKLKGDKKKMDEEKQMSEKKSAFDKMLVDGKVVEAQREHYMSGDMVKFSESFVKPNQNSSGHAGGGSNSVINTVADAQKEVDRIARVMLSEGKVKNISEGMLKVLRDNPELNKKIYG